AQDAVPDQGEPLARRAAEDDVDPSVAEAGRLPKILSGQVADVSADGCAHREVELVDRGVDRVQFDSGHDLEPRLLEAQRQAARTGEHVNGRRAASTGRRRLTAPLA